MRTANRKRLSAPRRVSPIRGLCIWYFRRFSQVPHVVFVEGERKADRLAELGIMATCAMGGANTRVESRRLERARRQARFDMAGPRSPRLSVRPTCRRNPNRPRLPG